MEAEAIGRDLRAELGLTQFSPLNAWLLAEHLDIPIEPLSGLGTAGAEYFLTVEPSAFSAVTIFRNGERRIIHNDAHSPARQTSNIAHECAHGLLLHPPTPVLTEYGCRHHDPAVEAEANWLAGVLLVPEAAALSLVRRGLPVRQAAMQMGVSEQMMSWRINVTGARRRVASARRGRVAGAR